MSRHVVALGAALGLGLAMAAATLAQQAPTPEQQVAALKASLAANQKALRQYEWIETVIVNLKGEEKSRLQNRCYYGADGQVQKVQVTAPPPPKKMHGLRGKIAEHKKEELTDYMKEAVALVKRYVPPDAAHIQVAKDAGRVSFTPLPGGGRRMRLTFADYLKPGDSLAVEVDFATNQLLGSKVSTFLGSPPEPVILQVTFATFLDGVTSYTKDVVLNAQAKEMVIKVENSGYRKVTP
jgi:hypothetical protein